MRLCQKFGVALCALTLLVALAGQTFAAEKTIDLAAVGADAGSKTINAMLITGGCCHDYKFQSETLVNASSKTVNIMWTVVNEGVGLPDQGQNMLLGILDLEKVTVDDIMVPRNEIVGIDIAFNG